MHALSDDEKSRVKASYALLLTKNVNLGRQFFHTLFELAPLVRPMFKKDIEIIEVHFNELIGTAVQKIDSFDDIQPVLFGLGKKTQRIRRASHSF